MKMYIVPETEIIELKEKICVGGYSDPNIGWLAKEHDFPTDNYVDGNGDDTDTDPITYPTFNPWED